MLEYAVSTRNHNYCRTVICMCVMVLKFKLQNICIFNAVNPADLICEVDEEEGNCDIGEESGGCQKRWCFNLYTNKPL